MFNQQQNQTVLNFKNYINTFKKIQKLFNIFVPLLIIGYYVYLVISHLDGGYLLVINSIMLGLLTINYIINLVFIFLESKNKKLKKNISKVFKYLKHIVKIVATGFAVYEIIVTKAGFFKVLFTIITVLFVIIQTIVDIIVIVLEILIKKFTSKVKDIWQDYKFNKQTLPNNKNNNVDKLDI